MSIRNKVSFEHQSNSTDEDIVGIKYRKTGFIDGHCYEVVNSEPFPSKSFLLGESFPLGFHVRILRKLDLPDLLNLSQVSHFCHGLAARDDVWIPKAIAVGCPIKEDSPVFGLVRSFVKLLQIKVTRSFERTLGVVKMPPKIELFLKQPAIPQINYLQQWLRAKDTIIVWEKLSKPDLEEELEIELEGPGTEILRDSDVDIEKAKEFSAWFAQNRDVLMQIVELDLSGEQLTSLPKQLGQLTDLIELNLDSNQLSSLPTWIGQLTRLQFLEVQNNQLTCLPTWIGQFTDLMHLTVQNNQLTSLPTWIGQLTHLDYLEVSNNQLTSLPKEIGSLPELSQFFASNNQITSLPREIINKAGKFDDFDLKGNPLSAEVLIDYL